MSDDDLFSPTLTEEDDAVSFNQPWNPWSLVVLTFFFGLIAGGGLLAFNWERLGIQGRRLSTLFAVLAASVVLAAVSSGLAANFRGQEYQRVRRQIDVVEAAAATGIAIVISAGQRKRYRLFRQSHQAPGPLVRPAIAAAAVSLAAGLLLRLGFYMFFRFFETVFHR